jgi:hypothetical protein
MYCHIALPYLEVSWDGRGTKMLTTTQNEFRARSNLSRD